MEFFGNGKKGPPKGGATGLFIDPEEVSAPRADQKRNLGGQGMSVEDVPVKPVRSKPQGASTLDLGDILDVEVVEPKAPAKPHQKPAAKQAKALKAEAKQVLDIFAEEPSEVPPVATVPVAEDEPTPTQEARITLEAEPTALEPEAVAPDTSTAPEQVNASDQPPVMKLVAEEVEDVAPVFGSKANNTQANSRGVPPVGDPVEQSGLKMNFKSRADRSPSADSGDRSPEPNATKSGESQGFFKSTMASKPFSGFKSPFAPKSPGQDDEKPSKPLEPRSKGKGFGGFFSAKKPIPEGAGEGAPTGKKSPFSGFGKSKSKSDEKPKDKAKAKPEKAPKLKPAKGSGAKRVSEQYIAVSLTVGTEMFWRVTETSIEQVEVIEGRGKGPIASFTKDDVRIYVDAPQSNRQAAELALQALEEKPRIINLSKTSDAIFTTAAQRLAGYKVRVGPGLPLLQTLLKPHFEKNKDSLKDVISGFLLLNAETKELLVLLYHFDINGNISPPEVTANPTDVHMTLRQFANSRKVDPASADILLFRNEELLSAGTPKHLYPSDADFLGIPVTAALSLAAVVTTVVALGGSGFAAQEYLKGQQLSKKSSAVKQDTQMVAAQVHDLLSSSVTSFAKHQTLDIDSLVKQAQEFWIPRSTVVMTAGLAAQTYSVTLPLAKSATTGAESSLLNAVNTDQVMALTNMAVPDHCTKQSPSVSGTLDVIQLTVNCETAPGPFDRYRAN